MNKDTINAQYQKSGSHQAPVPARRPLTQREAQIKQRFREPEKEGEMPLAIVSNAPDVAVAIAPALDPIVLAPAKRHDPLGWLLKRFGVLFLVAITIAIVLLIALPHGHATATSRSHPGHLRPQAASPRTL
jgi:hypothetical protein